MFDPFNTDLADLAAGGPRKDLDDVHVSYPCPIADCSHVAVDERPLLERLAETLENVEERWIVRKAYGDGNVQRSARELERRVDGKYAHVTLNQALYDMGAEIYLRHAHLKQTDIAKILGELGYQGSAAAMSRALASRGASPSAERARQARLNGMGERVEVTAESVRAAVSSLPPEAPLQMVAEQLGVSRSTLQKRGFNWAFVQAWRETKFYKAADRARRAEARMAKAVA